MSRVLRSVWEFPQVLVGLFLLAIGHKHMIYDRERKIFLITDDWFEMFSGVSLGWIIILRRNRNDTVLTIAHEGGHSKQSLYLGPLYLLAVGLPSVVQNMLYRYDWYRQKVNRSYYKFCVEAWADKLAGIEWYGYSRRLYDE